MQEGDKKAEATPSQQYEAVPVSPAPQPQAQEQPQSPPQESQWQFTNDDQSLPSDFAQPSIQPIKWTASEFIAHSKNASWYLAVLGGAIVAAALVYFATRGDRISTGMVIITAILFAIMGSRKPRELEYVVGEQGIQVGQKFYPYGSFKSFSVVQEGGVESIWFMPLERLKPGLSIYFAPPDGQKIVDALSQVLPVESRELDPLDRLMHKIRF